MAYYLASREDLFNEAVDEVPEELIPAFADGYEQGEADYQDGGPFNPDLSHLKTDDEKRTFVNAYALAVRLDNRDYLEPVDDLVSCWRQEYIPDPGQKDLDQFVKSRENNISRPHKEHFYDGYNKACEDTDRELFFTKEQKTKYTSNMLLAFWAGIETGYEVQDKDFEVSSLKQYYHGP